MSFLNRAFGDQSEPPVIEDVEMLEAVRKKSAEEQDDAEVRKHAQLLCLGAPDCSKGGCVQFCQSPAQNAPSSGFSFLFQNKCNKHERLSLRQQDERVGFFHGARADETLVNSGI